MTKFVVEHVAQFSVFCVVHYSTITVATALVALIMATVLIVVRSEALKAEDWILYLGCAFGALSFQYGFRALGAWVRSGNYSTAPANFIDIFAQSFFSNINSLAFLLAALALLYRLPHYWLRTRWRGLVGVFSLSFILGVTLHAPWDRYFDAVLSALCLLIVSWAMFVSSGTRQRRGWARLNLIGGGLYALLHVVYACVPALAHWRPMSVALGAELGKSWTKSGSVPSSETVLNAGIFALAFMFKVLLFVGALFVVMRCLSALSPSVSRAVLEPVKIARGEFLAATGIVRAMAESIGADAATLYFKLPGSTKDAVASLRWAPGLTQPDLREQRERRFARRAVPEVVQLFESANIFVCHDRRTDLRFRVDPLLAGPNEMRSFVNVPLLYHGAVIGALKFDWKKKASAFTTTFTATDVQRVRQIADLVTPVVQAERWLRAVADLRERLQHYNFDPAVLSAGTFIGHVATELHDILSPLGTLVTIDFGFNAQWAMCNRDERRSSDDRGATMNIPAIEEYFRQSYGHGIVFVETHLTLRDHTDSGNAIERQIGEIIFAIDQQSDWLEHPTLTQDRQQLQTIAALVKDVVLDLHRKRLSNIIHRLHNDLDGRGFASEEFWEATLRQAGKQAGLLGVEVARHDAAQSLWESVATRIEPTANAINPVEYRVCVANPGDAFSEALIEMPLLSSGETLLLGVARLSFGRELSGDRDLAWKLFLDRFSDAADSSLVRIRAIALERNAMEYEMHSLLVHELRNQAERFRSGIEWADKWISPILESQGNERRSQTWVELRETANKFRELADALKPAAADARAAVTLLELRQRVDRIYDRRLAARAIELQWDIRDTDTIHAPSYLAYLVLVSLIQNSADAIGEIPGKISVHSESSAGAISVHVDDTGSGVSSDVRDHIFETGVTSKPNGSGLGLSLARRVLKHYRAEIFLADKAPASVATRFTIRFPRSLS